MPVYIRDIKFQDQYTGVISGNGSDTGTDKFIGCVGDLIYLIIDFYVQWKAEATFTFDATTDTITKPSISGRWIDLGFQVGDTIEVVGSVSNDGTYTIESINNFVIKVVEDITTTETTNCIIYGTTAVNGFDFYYNMVGNSLNQNIPSGSKNFVSLTDFPSIQKFTGTVGEESATTTLEPNATSLAWWDWEASTNSLKPELYNNGTDDKYRQNFILNFQFFIKPFSDRNQYTLLNNAYNQGNDIKVSNTIYSFIEPTYFYQQCLAFIYQIDAKYLITNPKPDQSTYYKTVFGNTAWYNQFFPTGIKFGGNTLTKTQYEFHSIAYGTGDALRYDVTTAVTLVIKKLSGNWSENDKYVVHFAAIPNNDVNYSGYQNKNQHNFRQSFYYDRCYNNVGGGPVDGDMYGTDIQAIARCTSSAVTDMLTITFDLDLGLNTQAFLALNPYYMIWVTPQDYLCDTSTNADRSAILCDVNKAFTNTDDATLLQFYGWPDNVMFDSQGETFKTSYIGLLGEYGRASCKFQVKENCIIKKINTSIIIKAYGIGLPDVIFPIEQWNNETEQFWNGKLTDINILNKRNFDIVTANIFNERNIIRQSSDDIPGYYSYLLQYGFQVGYQFWQNLLDIPNMYLSYSNNYWPVYSQGSVENGPYLLGDYNTEAYFKIYWEIYDNATGNTTEFENLATLSFYDSLNNFATCSGSNNTYDYNGNDLQGGFLLDNQTSVVSFFESVGSVDIIGTTATSVDMILYYEYENRSVWDVINTNDSSAKENSAWVNVPTLVYTSYQVNAAAYCDFSKFNIKPQNIRLYSKIYY